MFGKTDFKTRNEEEITYMHWKADFEEFTDERSKGCVAGTIEANWLHEMLDYQHDPADRVMAVMPLILYEVKRDILTNRMKDELYGTKEDFEKGLLDELPEEELLEIKKDLEYCINKIEL